MGKFDVKPIAERRRAALQSAERVARFDLHRSVKRPECACAFSERRVVTCGCCGGLICFCCGGVLQSSYMGEYLNRHNEQFDGEFVFDDSLDKL